MMFIDFKRVVWSLLTIISLFLCFTSTAAAEPKSAVGPVLDCDLDNDMYICTGAQYLMYCNTTMHHFYYQRYQNQNQNQYQYQYQCMSNDCMCVGNKDTCACYYNTSSCFCETLSNNTTVLTVVRPVLDCELNNDTYICIGAQYHMYCNTSVHYFSYYKYQYQNQYQYRCWSNNCDCRFNKDSCLCYSYTSSSCFCTNYGNSITLSSSRNPVTGLDCLIYNDTYICTGAQHRMYCHTKMHYFYYWRYQNQYQYQCMNNNCNCVGDKDTCTCSTRTLSSCFCETYGNSIALPAAVSPVYDCVLHNDTYICTGAQYRMYCNTRMHDFSYQRFQYQNQYQCVNNNCNCIGNKDTCTCSTSILSSCFCEIYGNIIALFTVATPAYGCVLYNDTYICTGAQYRMYCNTRMHSFSYQRYRNQNQDQYQCWNNNCNCVGNKDTCTCYSSTLSSCFCETFSNSIAFAAVTPAYGCVLYNDTYICTGAQYRMYCNTRMQEFYYQKYLYQTQYELQCRNNNCNCRGNMDTCTCSSSTLSSCFCETYSNNITIPTAVIPLRGSQCELYNDTYICTGAQYRMYCNTRMHDFYYRRYQNQNQYELQCWNNNCNCRGNMDTCTCSSSTLSSCFCEIYGNIIALFTVATPAYGCMLYNDTYICTGAQYRMYCNTTVHYFSYWRSQNQNQNPYQCWNNCDCRGNKDTCTCYSSALSSCFCTNYNNTITIPAAVSPVTDPDCVLHNDMYICTGAQYRMYCNTRMHDFSLRRFQYQNQYQCVNNNCNCISNKDTCTCYRSTLSSCFCETYSNSIALTTAVSPVYDCVLYNDTSYICTGAQYRMYCNTTVHDFYYNINEHRCASNICDCRGNKNTCTCYYSTSSSCFCTNYGYTIPAAGSPVHACGLYNDTYICTGAQYCMYCNTRMHSFSYQRYRNQNQDQYQCWSNNCDCVGNKDTCTCSSSTLSSCFCEYNICIPTTINPTTAVPNITLPDQCESQASEGCLQNVLDQIENITAQELPVTTVTSLLTMTFNASEKISESSSSSNPAELASFGNRVLKTSEKLISTLVKPTDTSANVSFTLASVEGQVFMVGPQVTLENIPRLDTTNSSVDIDLIGIAKNNNEKSAAVAFMSYNTMENLLKPDFFNTSNDTIKTMMSTVISATLPKTTNTKLTKPVNFTLRHIREFDPSGSLFCVYWNISEWIVDGCSVLKTTSSYTVCSCHHLSTFALIMQTSRRESESDSLMDLLNLVCVIVGLAFFSLALLTFALCQWSPGVNNVARINICISLLLAHLLFLLTQRFLSLIRPLQVLCAVISGLLHFLFLSGFVWMFIEAVLLFICVKNLSQISS
uniref:Uncharacterized protein n=1 Tax=Cyprinus carpio carpio TaxID=630221 RepID=A0A9J8D4Y7_CYPCA